MTPSAHRPAAAPRVLLVVAATSDAGKTTLLERTIPRLRAAGLRVAAIKRTHHDVDLDPRGKDSRRLRDAGASPVVLRGPHVTTIFAATPPRVGGDDADGGLDALVAAAAALSPVDLVLVEGGRDIPGRPRIEVVPSGGAVVSDPATLVAVVADHDAGPPGVPRFPRDAAGELAAHLAAWVRG